MEDDFDIIRFFHENTKATTNTWFWMDHLRQPMRFKDYTHNIRVPLPKVGLGIDVSLKTAILRRRSCRNFLDKPISMKKLSKILYYSYGVTRIADSEARRIPMRPIPSAGGLYPTEVYLLAINIRGLKRGVYHYSPADHSLALIDAQDGRYSYARLAKLFVEPNDFKNASLCILLTSVLERTTWKYKTRGYRFALLEAGHVVQNICLVSAAESLGAVPLGGFYDDSLAKLIEVDPENEPVMYTVALGNPI